MKELEKYINERITEAMAAEASASKAVSQAIGKPFSEENRRYHQQHIAVAMARREELTKVLKLLPQSQVNDPNRKVLEDFIARKKRELAAAEDEVAFFERRMNAWQDKAKIVQRHLNELNELKDAMYGKEDKTTPEDTESAGRPTTIATFGGEEFIKVTEPTENAVCFGGEWYRPRHPKKTEVGALEREKLRGVEPAFSFRDRAEHEHMRPGDHQQD